MQRVNGKTCIVTGAALGIGRACALRLAGEGASVALFDMLDEEGHALLAELQAAGHEAGYWHVDVADEAAVGMHVELPVTPIRSRAIGTDLGLERPGISGNALAAVRGSYG
ncbi:MAG TPA: SDR family NAD(P)-dependent oxidoreductase, partial [Thermomonas sp.]|nr:SDR family NAD(P)-dependent oxidoreductase [Thermomonas sp.]